MQVPVEVVAPPVVNEDTDMDISGASLPEQTPSTLTTMQGPITTPDPEEATNRDIIQTIEVLSKMVQDLHTLSVNCTELLHLEMDGQVTALNHAWETRFSKMEEKMRAIDLNNNLNATSLGHMANTITTYIKTGKWISLNLPPSGSSVLGHPYGQLPDSWLPMPDTPFSQHPEHSIS